MTVLMYLSRFATCEFIFQFLLRYEIHSWDDFHPKSRLVKAEMKTLRITKVELENLTVMKVGTENLRIVKVVFENLRIVKV
jgi:hypothetical protein